MFLVSNTKMVIEGMKSGVAGCIPALNYRTLEELRASIQEQKRNIITIKANLYNEQGEVCTEAVCTYFTFTKEKAQEMNFRACLTTGEDKTLEEIIQTLNHS